MPAHRSALRSVVRSPGLSAIGAFGLVQLGCASCGLRSETADVAGAADRVVIERVTVLDLDGRRHIPDAAIAIEGDRIVAVGKTSTIDVAAAHRIDGRGLFAIPGLWESHGHVSLPSAAPEMLPLYVANGVTSVRDLGGDPAIIDKVRAGNRPDAPRVFTAMNIVETRAWLDRIKRIEVELARAGVIPAPPDTNWLLMRFGLVTTHDAIAAVDSLKRVGADLVKIRNATPELFRATAMRARELDLPVAAHIPSGLSLADAVASGLTTLEHTSNGFLSRKIEAMPQSQRDSLWATFVRYGAFLEPTLVNETASALPDSQLGALVTDSLGALRDELRYAPSFLLKSFQADFKIRLLEAQEGYQPDRAANLAGDVSVLRAAYRAGVPFLAGTDVGGWLGMPGFGLQRELELLVELVGMSTWDALRAATINPATAMRVQSKLGRIASGYLADIVLLTADPTASISNTSRIAYVVRGGVVYDSLALQAMLRRFDRRGVGR